MRRFGILIGLALLIGLTGCSSDGVTDAGTTGASGTFAGDDFALVDAEDAFSYVEAADLEREMSMEPAIDDRGRFVRHRRHPRGPASHLGPILIKLRLDEDQRLAVRSMIGDFRRAVYPSFEGLRTVNRPLIVQANAARLEIIEDAEQGVTTKSSVLPALHTLNQQTADKIRNNPDNAPFFEQICNARTELFASIRSILDDEQQGIWDAWVAGAPSCNGVDA